MKGIAICWPQKVRRTAIVAASGRIPLHCIPRQATLPGSQLALVAPNGNGQLLCVVARIDGPRRVYLAAGEYKQNGYELVAKRGTIRTSLNASLSKLPFRWRAIGQLRYFDQTISRPLTIGEGSPGGPLLSDRQPEGGRGSLKWRAFSRGIPGLNRDNPEAKLVRRYVNWVGSQDHFLHAQALEHGNWTDLFNTTRWTLYEAKANFTDRSIR